MNVTWVLIPDTPDWPVVHRHCLNWLVEIYPSSIEGQDTSPTGDGDWGWLVGVSPHMAWWFRNPEMAMHFKLVWGGK